ncbi:hypothetical protein [Chromobacterium sp. CV08]|uniref:hypothetical protein n=1 Tax=Chromobacterium sp. CV08 TaxID=3133274 RepID=UPI003DA8FC8C
MRHWPSTNQTKAPRITRRTEKKPTESDLIYKSIIKAKELLGIGAAIIPWYFPPSYFILHTYLSTIGYQSQLQASISSGSGLLTIALLATTLSFCVVFFIAAPPFLTTYFLDSLHLAYPPQYKKLSPTTIGITFFILITSFLMWSIINDAETRTVIITVTTMTITYIALTALLSNTDTKKSIRNSPIKKTGEIIIISSLGLLVSMLYTIPLLLLYTFQKSEEYATHTNQKSIFILAWAVYIAVAILSIHRHWSKIHKKETTTIKFHITTIAIFFAILIYFALFFPSTYAIAIARSTNIAEQENQSQWYFIKKETLEFYQPKISKWRCDSISNQSFLYGFMAFSLSDSRILCPIKTPLDKEVPYRCLILDKNDIVPIGQIRNWAQPSTKKSTSRLPLSPCK